MQIKVIDAFASYVSSPLCVGLWSVDFSITVHCDCMSLMTVIDIDVLVIFRVLV